MTNSGDAAEQVIRIGLDGVEYVIRIAGAGAKNLASLIMAALKSNKTQPTTIRVSGHERLKRMLKSGQPLDVFPVREKDIKAFCQEAKKYGIVYCAVRDKEPKADGTVDVLVRKEDSPKINRVMERLQYGEIDTATIRSEVVRTRAEQGQEPQAPSVPDRSDALDVDSFLDTIMPGEGKSVEGQNQAVQPPVQQKAAPEVQRDFPPPARTRQNPSGPGLDSISRPERTTTEPPSIREEIAQIRADLKKEAQQRNLEPKRSGPSQQRTTRHQQPPNTRKPKSKNSRGR